MFRGVETVCFTATYVVVFLLEAMRVRCRESRAPAIASLVLLVAGAIAHASFLYYHDLLQNSHFFASAGGWFFVLSFAVVCVLLYLVLFYPRAQFGLFFLPLALALIAFGILAGDATFTPASTCRWVRAAHGVALLVATLASLTGSITGGMYCLQRRRLRQRKLNAAVPLPSLEWLSLAGQLSVNASLIALGIGVASGFYLKIFASTRTGSDVVAIGATVLFAVALALRIWRARSRSVDALGGAGIQNFVLCAALLVLLCFAAFPASGHWKQLTRENSPSTSGSEVPCQSSSNEPGSR